VPSSAAEGEPERQIRLSYYFLLVALAVVFLISALLDIGIIFAGPLALAVFAIWGLALLVRGLRVAWKSAPSIGVPAALAPLLSIVAFIAALMPVVTLGNYSQAAATLLLNQASYESAMAKPEEAPFHKNWTAMGGKGKAAFWSFGYGGSLSIERDIIFDPLDRPESRSLQLVQASAASCRPLWSHYYDCTLDY